MPRQARLDAPGVLHHIMIRGIEGRKIFRINEDRNDFIERLERLLPKTQTACYAWAFLPGSGGEQTPFQTYLYFSAWAVQSGDVSAVPVPAAVWLFGSGLIGLVGFARRKKA